MKFKDQLNRALFVDSNPMRIVSLVPSLTELLVDLGLEDKIVGITKFCIHPTHLKKSKTIVGGTKDIQYKKVEALNPDIIICNKEENTLEMISKLEKKFSVYVSDVATIENMYTLILNLGQLLNCSVSANQLIKSIKYKLNDFKNHIKLQSRKRVAYFIWTKPWMVVGGNTFINTMLTLNNFENIFESSPDKYFEVYIEYLTNFNPELRPEIILLPSEPFPFKNKHMQELKKYIDCQFIFVDGEMFSWYGSRLLYAFDYFKELHTRLISN